MIQTKQLHFLRKLKSSAGIYESSGSQFFRTTIGIQSGLDVFDESRFVMNFLTILAVIEILCSFRLVSERKTGKVILKSSRLEFLEKFFSGIYLSLTITFIHKMD